MAVRNRLYHPDEVRTKIQTSQLLNRLNDFVNGKVELTPHQVTAALGLIRKTLPDLAAMEHSGEVGQPSHIVSAEPLSEAQWQQTYGSGEQPVTVQH